MSKLANPARTDTRSAQPFRWRAQLSRPSSIGVGITSVFLFLLLWTLVTLPGGLIPSLFLPPPGDVFSAFVSMLSEPYLGETLFGHVRASLWIVFGGWLVGGLVGVPLGIAMAWWKRLRWIVFPVFLTLRPIPPLAWIPLAIIWLGIGDSARIYVVFLSAVVPWVINSMAAVESVDPLLIRAATALGAPSRVVLIRVVLRTALPTFIAAARIALGNAWTTLVAAELLAASVGLGFVALTASRGLDTGRLLVAMFVIGALGALFSIALQWTAKKVAPWMQEGKS